MKTSKHIARYSFADEFVFRIDQKNWLVRSEQLHTILKSYPMALLAQALAEPLFVLLMWGSASHQFLILWVVVMYMLHGEALLRWLSYKERVHSIPECREWSRHFFIFALVGGMMWGFGTIFFFPHDLISQMLLVSLMLALAVGATGMGAVHAPSFHAFALGLMLPLIFRVMVEQDETHLSLSLILVLFLAVMLVSRHFIARLVLFSIRQRFENHELELQLVRLQDELNHKRERNPDARPA